jgi:hypothetical protein
LTTNERDAIVITNEQIDRQSVD